MSVTPEHLSSSGSGKESLQPQVVSILAWKAVNKKMYNIMLSSSKDARKKTEQDKTVEFAGRGVPPFQGKVRKNSLPDRKFEKRHT